jgi:hypothetical protein
LLYNFLVAARERGGKEKAREEEREREREA